MKPFSVAKPFPLLAAAMLGAVLYGPALAQSQSQSAAGTGSQAASSGQTAEAIVAGGCFWCVESDFEKVPGVREVISGYAGGEGSNPTYDDYSSRGYREAARIIYDPGQVSYRQLMDTFFRTVDPLDDGGQFCDRGYGYTTAIWPLDEEQKREAEAAEADASETLGRQVRTPIEPIGSANFGPAEDYHQNYYKSENFRISPGGLTAASAYKYYRQACGRDERVNDLWGDEAFQGVPGHENGSS